MKRNYGMLDEIEELAYIINSVDGGEVPPQTRKIINLYSTGTIDLETAKFAIGRMFTDFNEGNK